MNRREIYNKYNGHCAYCGKKMEFDDMTVDHIIPSSKGGANNIENTIPSCLLCNNQKADKSIEEFRKYIENITESLDEDKPYRLALRYKKVTPVNRKREVKFYYELLGDI